MRNAGVLIASLVSLAAGLHAQPRPRRATRPRPRVLVANAPPLVGMLRAEHASLRDAREALGLHLGGVQHCLVGARERDPAALAGLRSIEVTVRLTREGTASSVEFDPPLLAQGLSTCLAMELLGWRQAAPFGPRPAVYFRIEVAR